MCKNIWKTNCSEVSRNYEQAYYSKHIDIMYYMHIFRCTLKRYTVQYIWIKSDEGNKMAENLVDQ